MKLCPFCAEEIQDAAIVCKHCGRDLRPGAANPAASAAVPVTPPSPGVAGVLSFLIPGLGHIYIGKAGGGIVIFGLTVVGYLLFIVPGLIMHVIAIIAAVRDATTVAAGPTGRAAPPGAMSPMRTERWDLTPEEVAKSRRQGKIILIVFGTLMAAIVIGWFILEGYASWQLRQYRAAHPAATHAPATR